MTLKELRELMDLCRKKGIKEIKLADVSLVMGDIPARLPRGRAAQKAREAQTETPEEFERIAFFSAGGPLSEDH